MAATGDKNAQLKIGLVTAGDPLDKRAFSGTYFTMLTVLQREFCQVVPLGPYPYQHWLARISRILDKVTGLLGLQRYDLFHSHLVSWIYARYFTEQATAKDCDVLFAPVGSTEMALMSDEWPIVYASDATVKVMEGYYPGASNIAQISRIEANTIEQRAITRADAITFSSQWAKDSAIIHYGSPAEKIHVIPYGANLQAPPDFEVVARRASQAGIGCCHLLFLGVDWERKGGKLAVEAFDALLAMGVDAHLTIVGCNPKIVHDKITIHPSLNKNDPQQYATLVSIFDQTHMMLVPTRADCTPIAFCEAAAYGMPVFTTATGGVASVVEHGKTGFCLEPKATGMDYAKLMADLWLDEQRFAAMVLAARHRYETVLNWGAWGRSMRDVFENLDTGNNK